MLQQPFSAADTTAVVSVPEPTELAIRYHRSGNLLWAAGTVLELLVPAALLFTGLSARIRSVARRVGRRWLPTVALYGVLYALATWLLTLPFAYYAGYVHPHAYGLSNQTVGQWAGDGVKGLLLGCIGAALALPIPYLLLRRSPRRWWLYTALATLPLAALVLLVAPLWISPLFDRYEVLADERLEARILALAERAGVADGRVYQVAKSEDTKTVNAYVTGLGATKRIVLWDTLLRRLGPEEVLFVVGHELGHYVLHHVLLVILVAAALVGLSLYAVHRLADRLIARHRRRFGFDRLSDVASLPLLVLLGGLAGLVATPCALALSRHLEREADRFGLELTRNNRAAALAFVRLQQENLAVPRPGPLYTLWRASHPSLAERIEFANGYRPWATDRPLRYGRYFEEELSIGW